MKIEQSKEGLGACEDETKCSCLFGCFHDSDVSAAKDPVLVGSRRFRHDCWCRDGRHDARADALVWRWVSAKKSLAAVTSQKYNDAPPWPIIRRRGSSPLTPAPIIMLNAHDSR
jgi:hypothetical protein